jgi:ubiquinone/menaquinone biosynthesis C-methylase UbiE
MRCLEIGAGAGSVATWMSKVVGPTGRVVAVDISTRFLSKARRTNVDVHEADIRTIDLQPASFDFAHARFVFIHLADWRAALDATLRLLKPGGHLVLEEPDFSASERTGLLDQLFDEHSRPTFFFPHSHGFSP